MKDSVISSHSPSKGIQKAPPRFLRFEEDSIELSVSKCSKKSKSPGLPRKPNQKHTQLMSQIDRLVTAQNAWEGQKASLQSQIKEARVQIKRLSDQNARVTSLLRQRNELYEEMRMQLLQQLGIIANLEAQLRIPQTSIEDEVRGYLKKKQDNSFAETFYSEREIKSEKSEKSNKSIHEKFSKTSIETQCNWAQLYQNIAKDLGEYVQIKMSSDLMKKKLEQRELEIRQLKQEIAEITKVSFEAN